MNIKKYLNISKVCMEINSTYTSPEIFKKCYTSLEGIEQKSLITHVIIKNIPFLFRDKPLLFEQIIQYLSDSLDIEGESIKLIGSAKTGFSVSPPPCYGKKFSDKSDLDFTIINNTLFDKLENEYQSWKDAYIDRIVFPKSETAKRYWDDNVLQLKNTINRGFIDTNKIPNIEICPTTKKINNAMYLIPLKLKEYHDITTSKASVRVYKNYHYFYNQLKINTDRIV